ncbi:hypothetical protein LTR37_006809 [Vermiconidia calcicola]|uniref:Uncharacterized protein n=2 Tax=Vermiconidia calcicola TaxID=1690605 RepID=A0ACC3NF17_9PEZI|nr:hypothetical protein LTR37_008798 [Vermiconidia calcicola]KAK3715826.1 hypothetical protein LTR37_006809 [Vermiconidia calcicola]
MSNNAQNEVPTGAVPVGDEQDNDYVSRTGQSQIPVQSDNAKVETGVTNDSDEMLEKDDKDAIDKSNIVEGRTRGAAKASGTYQDPGDEEGLPTQDGTSST